MIEMWRRTILSLPRRSLRGRSKSVSGNAPTTRNRIHIPNDTDNMDIIQQIDGLIGVLDQIRKDAQGDTKSTWAAFMESFGLDPAEQIDGALDGPSVAAEACAAHPVNSSEIDPDDVPYTGPIPESFPCCRPYDPRQSRQAGSSFR